MDFLREVWLVLVNVPDLAHRYKGYAVWVVISGLISVGTFLIEHRFPNWEAVLTLLSRLSMAVTVIVFVLAFIDLARSRLPFDDLVCTDIAVDAYYQTPADRRYEFLERCRCINRTDAPIRNLAPLQDGYFEKLPAWGISYVLVGKPGVDLVVHKQTSPEERKNNFGGPPVIYLYGATAELQPPLASGKEVDFAYRITAGGVVVDESAFSHSGALFARGVTYNTLRYTVSVHPPAGYEAKLREWGVIDAGGRLVPEETRRQVAPLVTPSGSILQWRVTLARKHLRYMLRYSFESYGFTAS